MPRKVFVAGEILTASDVNTNLMDQSVMVFDDDAARTTAIPTPVEGMVTYLKDEDEVTVFDGSAFVPVASEPDPPAILQVVSTTKTNVFSVASTSFTAITGLEATITPTATSSKILVTVAMTIGASTNFVFPVFILKRGATQIGLGDIVGSRIGITAGGNAVLDNANNATYGSVGINFLDSPSTTSATTYGVDVANNAGSFHLNRHGAFGDSGLAPNGLPSSTITLMEVAG